MSDRVLDKFNLRRSPFTVDIAPEGLYRFISFQQGQLRVEQALRQRGAMLVVGEPGTGKTALIRSTSARLPTSSFVMLEQLVPCAKTPIRAVVEGLLQTLGEPLPFNNPPRALIQLKRVLLDSSEKQRTPVLILDDVHHLTQNCWLVSGSSPGRLGRNLASIPRVLAPIWSRGAHYGPRGVDRVGSQTKRRRPQTNVHQNGSETGLGGGQRSENSGNGSMNPVGTV